MANTSPSLLDDILNSAPAAQRSTFDDLLDAAPLARAGGIPGMEKLGGVPPGPARPPVSVQYNEFGRVPESEMKTIGLGSVEGPMDTFPGLEQMASGGAKILTSGPTPTKKANLRQAASGGADVIHGAFQAAGPLAIPAFIANPLGTVATVATASAADTGTSAGLKALGVPEEYAQLGGAVAGALAGGATGREAFKYLWNKAGSPEIKFGKFDTPKEFRDMSDQELIDHTNKISQNPPKNAQWQKEQIVQEVARRQAERGMGAPEAGPQEVARTAAPRPEPVDEILAQAPAARTSPERIPPNTPQQPSETAPVPPTEVVSQSAPEVRNAEPTPASAVPVKQPVAGTPESPAGEPVAAPAQEPAPAVPPAQAAEPSAVVPAPVEQVPSAIPGKEAVQPESESKDTAEAKGAPPEQAAPQTATAKEPWQMTREEWTQERENLLNDIDLYERISSKPAMNESGFGAQFGRDRSIAEKEKELKRLNAWGKPEGHVDAVRAAIEAGKPVPPEVLADYPDLKRAATTTKTAAKPPDGGAQPSTEVPAKTKKSVPVSPTPETAAETPQASPSKPAAGSAKTESARGGEGEKGKAPWEMSPDELDAAHQEAKAAEKGDAVSVFGPERSKVYERAYRKAQSTMDRAGADAAQKIVEEMEGSLTEAQRNRLYGIGETGPTVEELGDYRSAVNGLDWDSPEALGQSLRWAVTDVGTNPDPAGMTHKQRVAFAAIRRAMQGAKAEGWDTAKVSKAALEASASRFSDPEDAAFMLKHFADAARAKQPKVATEAPAAPKQIAAPESPEKHSYASAQVNLPDDVANKVRAVGASIPDDILTPDGRETQPHVTVRYGNDEKNASRIEKALQGQGPITAKVKTLSIFPNVDTEHGKADVLKLDIDSPDLRKLNALVGKAVPHPGETFPKYTPHITVAYVKAGEGKKYAGRSVPGLSGQTITFDAVHFSPKEGEMTAIPLKPKVAAEKPAPSSTSVAETESALKASDVDFKSISDKIGNDLGLHTFKVDNGAVIKARRKITMSQGLVKTKYLHVLIVHPNGKFERYREQNNGNFTRTDVGMGAKPSDDPIAETQQESAKPATKVERASTQVVAQETKAPTTETKTPVTEETPVKAGRKSKAPPAPVDIATIKPMSEGIWQMTKRQHQEASARRTIAAGPPDVKAIRREVEHQNVQGGRGTKDVKEEIARAKRHYENAEAVLSGGGDTHIEDHYHLGMSELAVRKGKPVSPEVLADYPGLAKQPVEAKPESKFERHVEEPPILARDYVDQKVKAGELDDSGARTMDMAIRRGVLSEREADEIMRRAKGAGPITGKQVSDAFQSLAEGNPDFGKNGMEFGTRRIAHDSDEFQKQVNEKRVKDATTRAEKPPSDVKFVRDETGSAPIEPLSHAARNLFGKLSGLFYGYTEPSIPQEVKPEWVREIEEKIRALPPPKPVLPENSHQVYDTETGRIRDHGLTEKEARKSAKSFTDLSGTEHAHRQVDTRPEPAGEFPHETKKSGLAQNINRKAIEEGLTPGFENLPEYEKMSVKEQTDRAIDLVTNDLPRAIRIVMREEYPPTGLKAESVLIAVENYATNTRDGNMLRQIAEASPLSKEVSDIAQRLRILAERAPNSPVKLMEEVMAVREGAAAKKSGSKAKEKIKGEIKESIRQQSKKKEPWVNFVESIRCL